MEDAKICNHDHLDPPPDECPHCMKRALKVAEFRIEYLLDLLSNMDGTPGSTPGAKRKILEVCSQLGAQKSLASEWVFMVSEEDGFVYVSPKDHWEKTGYIPDTHCGEDFMPAQWVECMDHAYERVDNAEARLEMDPCGPYGEADLVLIASFARMEFPQAGLVEVTSADGEAARKVQYLRELAEDGFTEDENGEIIPITT